MEQMRSKRVLEKPNEPPLPEGHTSGSKEGNMKHTFELMDTVLDLEKEKDAQAMEILKLKQRVKSFDDDLDEEDASKQGRTSDKMKPMFKDSDFDDLDDLVDEGMAFVQEKDAKNQGVSITGEGVSTDAPRTPPTTTTFFDDEDVTMAMAQTLIKMKEEKAKVEGVDIKDGVLVEEEPKKVKRRDQGLAQIESDAKLAQRLHEEELAELDIAQKEKQKQEEATNKSKKRLLMLLWLMSLMKFKPEWMLIMN
ncbi:hypothetical protein Tco_0818265 [Tanacetum coccineum]